MLFKMATKDEVENEIVKEHLEYQDLKVVPKNNMNLHITRKRCVSTSIIISPSPKKKKKDCQNIIPPKKFLLGGTISDPLNLNSLQNEDVNKAMNKTPKSSPLHANTVNIKKDQVNVIIPRNLADPLELSTCAEAKSITHSDLDSFRKKSLLKSTKPLLKSLSDSGSLIEKTEEYKNVSIIDNNKQKKDTTFSSNKKLKTNSTENYLCKPDNNNIHCAVDIRKKIKEVSDNKVLVQPINKCNIPIKKTPIEVVVELSKTTSPLLKIDVVEAGKKIQVQRELTSKRSIVIPVVPQTALLEKHCKPQKSIAIPTKHKKKNINEPKFKEKNALFKFGNYNRYYGYRNPEDEDNRLKVLAERMDLFYSKDVLDIGCNIGHVTFSVARDFGAKSIVGMDIDRKLINIARKNVQYYINDTTSSFSRESNYHFNECVSNSHKTLSCDIPQPFPISFPMLYGPINLPGMMIPNRFPYNVSFIQGNYVLESDTMLTMETCKFDVILCLSITKWLHLNWGDDGLKRAFKRMFLQLRPGGILVVEPQPWKSYGRRKALTETIWKNYNSIQLKPPMFTEYLLNEVGFANCETLAMPHNLSKGFQRPLKLYFKSNTLVTRNVPTSTIVRPTQKS